MSDLEKYYNIYADLSQASYKGRPQSKMLANLDDNQLEEMKDSNYATFKFPNAKDAHGNDASTVYLQPDNTVKTIKEKNLFGREKEYQKGLLTDEKAGYNSYFVTDTPTLNSETKHTYFATRGSDGFSLGTLNDWVVNNGSFTLFNSYIPQAKLATKAMHQKITDIRTHAPNATMSITGHSLGTMVSIQAVANLPKEDISKIDKVVLFQGPDARESINNMSEQAQKKQKESLFIVGALVITYIFISALIIFNVEPDTFKNFFDALYWSTISLITVGYGDIYAVSEIGKLITMISSILGVAIIARPVSIMTAGYLEEIEKEDTESK